MKIWGGYNERWHLMFPRLQATFLPFNSVSFVTLTDRSNNSKHIRVCTSFRRIAVLTRTTKLRRCVQFSWFKLRLVNMYSNTIYLVRTWGVRDQINKKQFIWSQNKKCKYSVPCFEIRRRNVTVNNIAFYGLHCIVRVVILSWDYARQSYNTNTRPDALKLRNFCFRIVKQS